MPVLHQRIGGIASFGAESTIPQSAIPPQIVAVGGDRLSVMFCGAFRSGRYTRYVTCLPGTALAGRTIDAVPCSA